MKNLCCFILSFMLILVSCNSSETDTESIADLHDEYEDAIKAKNVEGMINCIGKEAINYFDKIVYQAKFSDSVNLSMQPAKDQIFVLYMRQTMSSDALRKYTGKEFMYFTLTKGVHVKSKLPETELQNVRVKGNKAEASILYYGVDSGNKIQFIKEDGKWKIDLYTNYKSEADKQLKYKIQQSLSSEKAYIKQMITGMSGKEMDNSIWHKTIPH